MITIYCASCGEEFELEWELKHLGPGEEHTQITCPHCKTKWRVVIQFYEVRA